MAWRNTMASPLPPALARLAACVSLLLHGALSAASLQITPVVIDMSAKQTSASITLSNPGDEPLYGQVRVFKWDQNARGDQLTPVTDVIASPPLIQIAAGQDQVVRLVRPNPGDLPEEAAYRLLIDEIAPPTQTDTSGVVLRLRYSVPVFVTPRQTSQPELTWSIPDNATGPANLQVTNAGARRAQIAAVQLIQGGKVYEVERGLLGYALAQRTRQWPLNDVPQLAAGQPLRVKAQVNGKPVEAPVVRPR